MQGATSRLHYACRESEIGETGARGFGPFDGLRRKVIVMRRKGVLYGWLDSCPHYSTGTPMAWKSDAYLNGDGTHLACHSHGALFDIETGECVFGPCLGQKLTAVDIAVSDAGEIFVAIPEEREQS